MASHHPSHASPARGSTALPPPPSSFPHGRQEFHLVSLGAAPSKLSPLPRRALAGSSFPSTFPSRSPSLPPRPRRVTPLPADPVLPLLWNVSASFFPASSRPLLFPPGLLFILAVQMLPHVWVFVGRCADNTEQLPRAQLSLLPLSLERCQVLCPCPTR